MYRQLSALTATLLFLAGACVGTVEDEHEQPDVDANTTTTADGSIVPQIDADPSVPTPRRGPPTPAEDPSCYTEPAFPNADISDVVANYGGSNWKDELIEAIDRRWPAGAWLLDAQRNDSYFDTFSDSSSWSGMVGWLDTLVHEETHLFNAYHAMDVGKPVALYFRSDMIFYPPDLFGFARSEIYDMLAPGTTGTYAQTYLTGSQGQRGFNPLLDELTAYSNELAAVGLVGEYYPGQGVSLRDGSVAFLYFLQLYLRRARTDHPDFYQQVKGNPIYRDIVETHWLRTHYFLEFADNSNLGINDQVYRTEMHRSENLAEIEMFIGHAVGDSSCLLD